MPCMPEVNIFLSAVVHVGYFHWLKFFRLNKMYSFNLKLKKDNSYLRFITIKFILPFD